MRGWGGGASGKDQVACTSVHAEGGDDAIQFLTSITCVLGKFVIWTDLGVESKLLPGLIRSSVVKNKKTLYGGQYRPERAI